MNESQKKEGPSSSISHLHAVSNSIAQKMPDVALCGGCNWATLPMEILREVLAKVEASEDTWPARRTVVACAGVCRSWRHITKGIVQVPEISGSLTFPISVKQPGPKDSLMRCFIRRSKSGQAYHLYLNVTHGLTDQGKLLLFARKVRRPTCTDYIISLHSNDKCSNESISSTCIGKLRSNFLGTKFTILDGKPPSGGASMKKSRSSRLAYNVKQVSPGLIEFNHSVGQVSYELNMLGTRGPRKMECSIGLAPAATQSDISFDSADPTVPLFHSKSARPERSVPPSLDGEKSDVVLLTNKFPRWHDNLQCWCLNFNGRVTLASVKNFQLIACTGRNSTVGHGNDVVLQFGKVEKDVFTMDYQYPLSAFQAFAICLSSFDTKIGCN